MYIFLYKRKISRKNGQKCLNSSNNGRRERRVWQRVIYEWSDYSRNAVLLLLQLLHKHVEQFCGYRALSKANKNVDATFIQIAHTREIYIARTFKFIIILNNLDLSVKFSRKSFLASAKPWHENNFRDDRYHSKIALKSPTRRRWNRSI